MKAIADRYTVPEAAVLAVQAGCDGMLICKSGQATQAQALEALVHAVESEELPFSRVESALSRHQRAKERFLAVPMVQAAREARIPPSGRQLRQLLGRDDHRAIAEEMARFS
jgi:beta-glucosidase-like glycosyl hydrolase